MRELYLIEEESTETFFVLRDEEGVRYQLARTEIEPEPAPEPEPVPEPEPEPEPEPKYSTSLTMRPNEIQSRIRAGGTVEELSEEMGVSPARIEAYAHPVLLERTQIAEAAKQSHPVREDGPAKLSLFEILATAFAARGHSISEATWDATREPGDAWVVHVRWQAGLSDNEATWTFKRSMGSPATTEARNSVAADLTDPDFVQPVRSLTAVGVADDHDEEPEELTEAPEQADESDEVVEGDFLQHPSPENQPQKRGRRAVTPHWEDVLLGVRTNTKRPRR